MFRSAAALRPEGMAGERWPLSRQQLGQLCAAVALLSALLVATGVVPLPSLVERWWQAVVPGSATPVQRLVPAERGLLPDGLGVADRRGTGSPLRGVGAVPGFDSADRPKRQRPAAHAPAVNPAHPAATTPTLVRAVSTESPARPAAAPTTTTPVTTVSVPTPPLPTTPVVTTPAVSVPAVTTPVATTPAVGVPPVTVPAPPGLP